jgi:DNA-binding NtrC family response regulator
VFNDERVTREVLPKRLFQEPVDQPMNWEHVEKEHILRVVTHFEGNKRQTAKAIGWAINTLVSKMEKYGIAS